MLALGIVRKARDGHHRNKCGSPCHVQDTVVPGVEDGAGGDGGDGGGKTAKCRGDAGARATDLGGEVLGRRGVEEGGVDCRREGKGQWEESRKEKGGFRLTRLSPVFEQVHAGESGERVNRSEEE